MQSWIYFIIWVAQWAGKMNQIPCCNCLPERARWSNLARSGLRALSCKLQSSLFWCLIPITHTYWTTSIFFIFPLWIMNFLYLDMKLFTSCFNYVVDFTMLFLALSCGYAMNKLLIYWTFRLTCCLAQHSTVVNVLATNPKARDSNLMHG